MRAACEEFNAPDDLTNALETTWARGSVLALYKSYIKGRVPKFLYFDEYYQMTGQDNLQALKKRMESNALTPSDFPLLGLIELARLDLDKILGATRTQALNAKLEGASNHLTAKVLKYWSQNRHLRLKFDVRQALPEDPEGMREGKNIWGEVENTAHWAKTPLSTRSRGFIWFFSFLAWFSKQKKTGEPFVLLLDEPGLFLHASAQADLLRYIEEELKPDHQVIFTTHSPFMVDPTRFANVRVVEDKSVEAEDELPMEEAGTKVSIDVLESTPGSLFPLQGALGYEISQTLFVGPHSLLVEGVSDLLYIQAMSGVLERQGRTGISHEWTITPVGGIEKVPTFVALLGSQNMLKVATLTDFAKEHAQLLENLYKRKLLKKAQVWTYADFVAGKEADVEDMFEPDFYLKLVNEEYAKDLNKPVAVGDLKAKSSRILVRLSVHLGDDLHINHYRPARYLVENIASLEADLDKDILTRWEQAFSELNALL